jgi:hypothetical protein
VLLKRSPLYLIQSSFLFYTFNPRSPTLLPVFLIFLICFFFLSHFVLSSLYFLTSLNFVLLFSFSLLTLLTVFSYCLPCPSVHPDPPPKKKINAAHQHFCCLLNCLALSELGIIGDNSTNRQRINRSTLSFVGYRLALETALTICRLKTKSDDWQIEWSIRTVKRYCRLIVWRKIVLTMLSIHRFKRKNSPMITQSIEVEITIWNMVLVLSSFLINWWA